MALVDERLRPSAAQELGKLVDWTPPLPGCFIILIGSSSRLRSQQSSTLFG
jgi:hypothetical protein